MLTSKQELNSKNTKQDLLTEESSEEAVKERVAKDGKKGGDDNDDDALRRRRRKTRYNSFSSSVYDEDARWKALHEERPDKPSVVVLLFFLWCFCCCVVHFVVFLGKSVSYLPTYSPVYIPFFSIKGVGLTFCEVLSSFVNFLTILDHTL